MTSKAYEKFMTSEPWRDKSTRFGFNQVSWAEELDRIKNHPALLSEDSLKIAEIGCGTALHLIDAARKFPKAVCCGFEPSENMFEFANQNVRDSNTSPIQLYRLASEDIPQKLDGFYDLVISILVGYFGADFASYAKKLYDLCAPKGVVLFFDFALPADLNDAEKSAVNQYLEEVIKVETIPFTLEQTITSFENAGFEVDLPDAPPNRLSPEEARLSYEKKSGIRADKEAQICALHNLDLTFLSGLTIARKFYLTKQR